MHKRKHKGRLLLAGGLALGVGGIGLFVGVANGVVGGQTASTAYPFMGALLRDGQFECGASLIDSTTMVTAKHCLQRGGSLSVRVGSNDRAEGGAVVDVSRTVPFDKNPDPSGSDIALLKLAGPVQGTPVKIAVTRPGADTAVRILGWGQACPQEGCEQEPPRDLKELDTTIKDGAACREAVSGKELCVAGTPTDAPCFGDSGGPALVQAGDEWELAGATSRPVGGASTCGRTNTIYTDVAAFRDWISTNSAVSGSAGDAAGGSGGQEPTGGQKTADVPKAPSGSKARRGPQFPVPGVPGQGSQGFGGILQLIRELAGLGGGTGVPGAGGAPGAKPPTGVGGAGSPGGSQGQGLPGGFPGGPGLPGGAGGAGMPGFPGSLGDLGGPGGLGGLGGLSGLGDLGGLGELGGLGGLGELGALGVG